MIFNNKNTDLITRSVHLVLVRLGEDGSLLAAYSSLLPVEKKKVLVVGL